MIEVVSFRGSSNEFQNTMRKDVDEIRRSRDIIVSADKSRNLYRMPAEEYKKLLLDNVTKSYRKAPDNAYATINEEARKTAKTLQLDDRMEIMAKS